MKHTLLQVLLCLLPVWAGCSPPVVSLQAPPPEARLDFDQVRDRWTRHQKSFDGLVIHADAYATYISPEFLAAFLQKYREIYKPMEREYLTFSRRWLNRVERYDCFFVALNTGMREWNDLLQANSIWRLYLENDAGQRVPSHSIREVKNPDELFQALFPFYTRFFRGYMVCFERHLPGQAATEPPILRPDIGSFLLEMRSPVATVQMKWQTRR